MTVVVAARSLFRLRSSQLIQPFQLKLGCGVFAVTVRAVIERGLEQRPGICLRAFLNLVNANVEIGLAGLPDARALLVG